MYQNSSLKWVASRPGRDRERGRPARLLRLALALLQQQTAVRHDVRRAARARSMFKGDVLRGRDVVCCVLAARQASNAADGRRLTDGPKFEKAVKLLALVKVSSAFVEHVFSQLAFIRRAIGDSASQDVIELRTPIHVNNGLMENYRARK